MATVAEPDALRDVVTCSVCQLMFRDPVILECGHNFCQECIEEAWEACWVRACPTCARVQRKGELTANQALTVLVKRSKESPQQAKEEPWSQAKCEEHAENVRLFCVDDGALACVVCRDAVKHSGHRFLPLQDADKMFRNKLESVAVHLKLQDQEIQKVIREQENEIPEHWVNRLSLEHHISSEFDKLHKFLNAREKTLLQELQVQGDAIKKYMEKNLVKLQSESQRVQGALSANQAKVDQNDPIAFLKNIKSIWSRCADEEKKFLSFDNVAVSTELCRGCFRGPIQYDAWKAMKSKIIPAAACLTLDPCTAHPRLTLSEDLTHVTHSSKAQRLPNNTERFSHYVVALGSEGFTSGRHYWEVEVADKPQWYLGVAKETVDRKQIRVAAMKDGYWAIGRANENEYKILDFPLKPLLLKSRPQTIGLYLDYEGGQLSFYNAGDMSHLYTFTDTFDTRLLPYFSPGVGEPNVPLKLIHPRI